MRGGVDLWALLAHMAENAGEWTAAVDAWEVKASMETGYDRAGSLVSAAACAGVAEDLATQERLLEEAAAEDENHPRLRLERLDEDAEPADQLAALEAIETDDSRALVLIERDRPSRRSCCRTFSAPNITSPSSNASTLTASRRRSLPSTRQSKKAAWRSSTVFRWTRPRCRVRARQRWACVRSYSPNAVGRRQPGC